MKIIIYMLIFIVCILLLSLESKAQNWTGDNISQDVNWSDQNIISNPTELPMIQIKPTIEWVRATLELQKGNNSLQVQYGLKYGDSVTPQTFAIYGSEFNEFYDSWFTCDDVYNLIYKKMGLNIKVQPNAGESTCYNVVG